jgi:GntR family transcriptional regulator, transcriptional repressor for pyruvate dehydrogenase complex
MRAVVVGEQAEAAAAWQQLGQGTLTNRIRLEIMRFLENNRLSPGDRLPSERELAAALGVSRPSVREAVRSLQAEGRLIVRHGQGVFVAEPAAQRSLRESMANLDHSLSELFAMREVLEVPAAQWAAQRQDSTALASVQSAFEDLNDAIAREPLDYEQLQRLDALFHLRIVQAAGNRLLEQTQGVLNDLLETGMRTTLEVEGRLEQSRREHERILTALLDGDASAAARAARTHVRSARGAANRRIQAAAAGVPGENGR